MEENAKDILNDAQRELDIEIMKEEKARGLLKKVNFCKRALDVTRSTRDEMMKDTRERIERETRTQFFNLLWKTSTFGDVQIKPDYSISLIHSLGYECLGSVSAGERELLALSFTLALHKASGFDSPILIDTPVARISDVTRKNVAKVLCEVSTTKQTILLFTPDEHSEEISSYLDGRASGRYSLKLSKDETEAIVEVL
jgi:DNA sulfur modification protein DndD